MSRWSEDSDAVRGMESCSTHKRPTCVIPGMTRAKAFSVYVPGVAFALILLVTTLFRFRHSAVVVAQDALFGIGVGVALRVIARLMLQRESEAVTWADRLGENRWGYSFFISGCLQRAVASALLAGSYSLWVVWRAVLLRENRLDMLACVRMYFDFGVLPMWLVSAVLLLWSNEVLIRRAAVAHRDWRLILGALDLVGYTVLILVISVGSHLAMGGPL